MLQVRPVGTMDRSEAARLTLGATNQPTMCPWDTWALGARGPWALAQGCSFPVVFLPINGPCWAPGVIKKYPQGRRGVIKITPGGSPDFFARAPPGIVKNTPGALEVMKNAPSALGGYEKSTPKI